MIEMLVTWLVQLVVALFLVLGGQSVTLQAEPIVEVVGVPTEGAIGEAVVMERSKAPDEGFARPRCTEDMACWDCATMGNLSCVPDPSRLPTADDVEVAIGNESR